MEIEFSCHFSPPDSAAHKSDPDHHYFITQRGTKHPLLGRFLLSDLRSGPYKAGVKAQQSLQNRSSGLLIETLNNTPQVSERILCIGCGSEGERTPFRYYSLLETSLMLNIFPELRKANEGRAGFHIGAIENGRLSAPVGLFDAVVVISVLENAEDVEDLLLSLTDFVDREVHLAKVIVVQGAPDNEADNLASQSYAAFNPARQIVNHQGVLLDRAQHSLKDAGFDPISLQRVGETYSFPGSDVSVISVEAAEGLAGIWYVDEESIQVLKDHLIPILEHHFTDCPNEIGNELAILTALSS